MALVIARIRLAQGRVGWFDELSRIHLTLQSPERDIVEGMNLTGVKRAVKKGSIYVISGSLEPPIFLNEEENFAKIPRTPAPAELPKEEKKVEAKAEESKKQEQSEGKTVEVIDIKEKDEPKEEETKKDTKVESKNDDSKGKKKDKNK